MNDSQRIKLQEMIDVNDTINHTEEIRQLNHSSLIRKDVVKIQQTKRKLKQPITKHWTMSYKVNASFYFKIIR